MLIGRTKKILKTISLLSSVIFFVLAAHGARAVTVSPVMFDESLDPGDAITGVIKLINETNQTQTYYVMPQNFVASGEEGQQRFLEEPDPTGLASWMSYDKRTFTLNPAESTELRWTVQLPKNAEPGGHYAAIFFSTSPTSGQNSAVGVGGKTGVLFLINVSGNIQEGANVASFQVTGLEEDGKPAKTLNYLPAFFELRLRNIGSVHFKPEGNIVIKNMFGKVSGVVPANAAGSKVLPASIRKLKATWGPKDAKKADGFISGVKNEIQGFGLGRYVAQASIVYGKQKQTLNTSLVFWIFPWRLTLLVLLGIIILFFLLKGYNRLVVRSAMSRMGPRAEPPTPAARTNLGPRPNTFSRPDESAQSTDIKPNLKL